MPASSLSESVRARSSSFPPSSTGSRSGASLGAGTASLRPSPISPFIQGKPTHTGPQLPLPAPPLQALPVRPPASAFAAAPGSNPSHPSHPAMPAYIPGHSQPLAIPSTRHGYASGGAMTQPGGGCPRYEPGSAAVDDVDVQLRPNRKLLFLGIGAALLGLVVIIALVASGGTKLKDNDGLAVHGESGSAGTG